MRKLMANVLVAILLTAGLGLTACKDTIKAPPSMAQDPLPGRAYPQNVAIEGLGKVLVYGDPVVDPSTADRPMSVSVPVRSAGDDILNIQYRFQFFDAQGRPLKSNLGWRFMNLDPKVQVFLQATSLETAAEDWRLQIRPAR